MARELTSTQHTNVEAGSTRPIYLVEWQYSGETEYLSCSGDVTYDSQAYTAGGLTIASIEDSKTATIVLPATAERITSILRSSWRGGVCKITAILAAPGDTGTYSAADGLLMLDGIIEAPTFSGELISVVVKCKYYTGALVPRFTFDDVISIIPAVGSVSTWEGENYSYEQWLKTTAAIQRIVRPGVNPQVTGRPSTAQVNTFSQVEQTGYKLLTAEGVNVPIVYGRATVPGLIFADGDNGGNKFIGVAWCMGEVFSIEKVFINDVEVPSTVTAKHYRGTTTQTVSPALQLFVNTSPAFSNDMILRTPAGNVGICYSVFNIPTSAISGAPRFRAIIQGRIVEDPTSAATDPYEAYTGFSFDFLTGLTDSGPNGHTLTLNGDAGISSPSIGLELDGTGDYAEIADSATLEVGSEPFTLEIEASTNTLPSSPGSPETLICHGSTASPLSRSLQVDMLGDELLLYLSSDGSTWDICDGLSCGTVVGSPSSIFRLVIERVDNQISTYLDGGTETGVVTTAAIYDGSADWEIGACGGAQEWSGVIRSARLTVGAYRYGSPHAITNTPFSDSGNYTAGKVYSEKPALAWNDLAKDPINGLAATTDGVQEAMEYGDSAMDSGAPRCRLGLVISDPRLVEQWLDQLAMYANCLWFPEGSNLKIIPDKIKDGTNGSGRELYTPASPEVFGSPLPTVTTEDGVSYSVSVEITAEATTSPMAGISVYFGGDEVIATQSSLGVHGGTVTVSGTSNTIEVVEGAGWDGTWANLSVKRTHRLIDQWLPSTLSVTGLPEGDKPNAVLTRYTVPDDVSGAWKQQSFGVMNEDAAAGDPMVLTTLDLPGVYRIEEASNKAIAKLHREDRKVRVSLISTDEEVVCQPGDTVQVLSTYRGIDAPVWVESSRMTSYGRFQVTGTIYRDKQFPDTDFTEGGTLDDGGYETIVTVDPECKPYSCSAYVEWLQEYLGKTAIGWTTSTPSDIAFPFSTGGSDGKIRYMYSLASAPTLIDHFTAGPTTNALSPSTGSLASIGAPDFCGENIVQHVICINHNPTIGNDAILPADGDDSWGDHQLEALITGFNGGSGVSGNLIRNIGKRWYVYYVYAGGPTEWGGTGFIGVTISNSGSDLVLTASIGNGGEGGYPTYSDSITVTGGATELTRVVASVATSEIELIPDLLYPPAVRYGIYVTIEVSAGGQSMTLEGYSCSPVQATSGLIATELANTIHTGPQIFADAYVSVASIAWTYGGFTDTSLQSSIAYNRNFTTYTPPDSCGI